VDLRSDRYAPVFRVHCSIWNSEVVGT